LFQNKKECELSSSVADPDPGSGAFLTLGNGSGIRIGFSGSRISDHGLRITNPYFLELSDKLLGKNFYNFLKLAQIFSSAFHK
jgi:hypothetical protein